MKKVHKADMVIHLWANQSQDEARTVASKGPHGRYGYGSAVNPDGTSSCSFIGPVLYSYATPVAMLHKGGKVALISSERYSVTTAAQLSDARRACSHLAAFSVPYLGYGQRQGRYAGDPSDWRVKNREYLAGLYAAEVASLEKSRCGPYHSVAPDYERAPWDVATLASLTRCAETVRDYCAAFGLKAPALDPAGDAARIVAAKSATWDRHKVAQDARQARRAAEWAARSALWRAADLERQRIAALEAPEKIAAWRAGEIDAHSLPCDLRRGNAMLRVSGELVQTSQGAEVPVNDARRACRFILSKYATGEAWKRNGERFPVGAFELDSVSESGEVRAGCHRFERAEVEMLAGLLGVQS